MNPQSKAIISLLMITNIFLSGQVNVLFAEGEKTSEAPFRNEFTEFSLASLVPSTPKEATFDDEVYSLNELMLIDLKPSLPLVADFIDDSIESDLTADISSPDQPLFPGNTSANKSQEMK
ncbi:MAG: hypothetical protein ACOYM0_08260 [Bacteroidales bacterium]